jgi:hypothetical protein
LTAAQTTDKDPEHPHHTAISLPDYEPKSMLQVHETQVDRSQFPLIDIHTHISVSAKAENGVSPVPER